MRTALTILVIVALVLVAVGAVNHGVTFDLDFLALSWTGVSLFWLSVVLAAVVVAAGAVAAWAARGAAVAAQRRLEKELGKTYKRLREAQAADERTAVAEVVAAEATALAPAPSEPAALAASTAAAEAVPADATAVTMAVAASSAVGWDEVAGAAPEGGEEAPPELAEVAPAGFASGGPDETTAGSAAGESEPDVDETTVSSREPLGDVEAGTDVTAVTVAARAAADAGRDVAPGSDETPGLGQAAAGGDELSPGSADPSDAPPPGS